MEPLGPRLVSNARFFSRDVCGSVYRFIAAAISASSAETDDLVQETLLEAWRNRHLFRGMASPLTWVLSIAKNKVRDRLRKSARRQSADALLRATRRMESEIIPDEIASSIEMGERVHRALSRIEPDYAELLRTRYAEGKSLREMAEERGESEEGIKSRLYRARRAFRKELESGEDEHDVG